LGGVVLVFSGVFGWRFWGVWAFVRKGNALRYVGTLDALYSCCRGLFPGTGPGGIRQPSYEVT